MGARRLEEEMVRENADLQDRPRRFGLLRGPGSLGSTRLRPITLRFEDPRLEDAFVRETFESALGNVRVAHLLALALWIGFGLIVRRYLDDDQSADIFYRYGIFVPVVVAGFALSFVPFYRRIWVWVLTAEFLGTAMVWMEYVERMNDLPPDLGFVGLALIVAFTYAILRLRFVAVAFITVASFTGYLVWAPAAWRLGEAKLALGTVYLAAFALLGIIAAYRLERFTRLLFVRERELERSKARSEGLLLNVLPRAIVDRLRDRGDGDEHLAEAFDDVTVLFADATGFTGQTEKTTPAALVSALDELFSRFDAVADRVGMEKIKTVGDAYMAVAGAPTPDPDHAAAGAEMGLALLEEAAAVRWPSGDPIHIRVGIASGPVVAGVIGRRKFSYDLWGDTVNLASRLETQGESGRILISEDLARRLEGRYAMGEPTVIDLKGKGPTAARILLGRLDGRQRTRGDEPSTAMS